MRIRLPRDGAGPWPSDRLARITGAVEGVDLPVDPWLDQFEIDALIISPGLAMRVLLALDERGPHHDPEVGSSLRYWIEVAKFVIDLLADQRFIPTLIVSSSRGNGMHGAWQPWLHDEDTRQRVSALLAAMPPVVRAAVDDLDGRPWTILNDALTSLTDATVRSALIHERFIDAIEDRDPASDPHVAWLAGLLDEPTHVKATSDLRSSLLRETAQWVSRLNDTGQDRPLRLCVTLNEPAPNETPIWLLTLHLQSSDDHSVIIDAQRVWSQGTAMAISNGQRVEHPQELLLAELGRASRVYPKIEAALSQQAPTALQLNTAEAHEFLRDIKPLLEESGFGVIVPDWWDQPVGRLGARLHIETPAIDDAESSAAESALAGPSNGQSPMVNRPLLGLNSVVNFRWQISIGDQPLTDEEFEALSRQVSGGGASAASPLVQVRGRWIEISVQQLAEARQFMEKNSSGQMTLLQAIHIANELGDDQPPGSLPVFGMDASGWVADVLGASEDSMRMPQLEQPPSFIGALRPYQLTGLCWLAFLDRFGLGACLADDMGLGKTIQLIALLLHERQSPPHLLTSSPPHSIAPTLLVVPTSVAANWRRELGRFAPSLRVHIHHGPDRPLGDRFVEIALANDVVITTYPLVSRDQETLRAVPWHRVALDEAQYIKNPPTKQTTAIRALAMGSRRLALTGTPVENRLSELWSIMEFLNPGYLGAAGEFRRRFGIPIERHRDHLQTERLRHMVRPFILRRVKTDPTVIDDLPQCLETKEFATLTPEQAALYQQTVNRMLSDVDRAEGIQRRGLVLATLVKLKQICNHPLQFLKLDAEASRDQGSKASRDDDPKTSKVDDTLDASMPRCLDALNGAKLSSRSGKVARLVTMLEEVLATGEKALIFTQFRQMGHLLTAVLQNELDVEALFLHGGTPMQKRQQLIDRFQSPEGGAPLFVLSLKAGGLGLNLTAANHVFHFDRWWNPAVENQATDRAFRIGQVRNVHVHKFVCVGTLEERIDQMIEQKTDLAKNIIGAGEQWLTELSTSQLRDLLVLREAAVATEVDA